MFSRDVAVLAVLLAALGDPVAAMVGIRFPGRHIFRKSIWGTAAMSAVEIGAVGVLHLAGAIEFRWFLVAGAVVAGIAELLPLPVDDNLRVPLAAGGAMALLGA